MNCNFYPTAMDAFAESATEITSGVSQTVPHIGNAVLCTDSICTAGRAAINFYCSPNTLSKVFFGASFLCGTVGAVSSGTALLTDFAGLPVAGLVGSLGARSFNRLGKYALHMGNVTNNNITNVSDIADLVN
jgi:hypothetical protein